MQVIVELNASHIWQTLIDNQEVGGDMSDEFDGGKAV
jgi:hypothetical protein